jgi:DNA-binding NarL/FixJ family response regulator
MAPNVIPFPAQRSRVLIVEDHAAIRQMVGVLVKSMPEFEVIGQAGTLDEAKRLAGELRPDIVVLDWMFPGGDGGEFLAQLKLEARLTEVLVFSATASAHAVREALMGGAKGFVEKGASMTELTDAIRAVAAGRVYFSPTVARIVEELVRRQPADDQTLSEREREVLTYIGEGLPTREIAERLNVSMKTVNNVRSNIAAKTGHHSIAQLTMHAARLGLIPGPHDDPANLLAPAQPVAPRPSAPPAPGSQAASS